MILFTCSEEDPWTRKRILLSPTGASFAVSNGRQIEFWHRSASQAQWTFRSDDPLDRLTLFQFTPSGCELYCGFQQGIHVANDARSQERSTVYRLDCSNGFLLNGSTFPTCPLAYLFGVSDQPRAVVERFRRGASTVFVRSLTETFPTSRVILRKGDAMRRTLLYSRGIFLEEWKHLSRYQLDAQPELWEIPSDMPTNYRSTGPNGEETFLDPEVVFEVDSGRSVDAVTPDGKRAFSVGASGRVIHWDLESGSELARWYWPIGLISSIDVSSDGLTACAIGTKGRIVLWDLS